MEDERSVITPPPKNGLIEAYRFVFTMLVVCHHGVFLRDARGTNERLLFYGGYIAVEFFFILSGYFLSQSAWKETDTDEYSIVWSMMYQIRKRLYGILPLFAFCYGLSFLADHFLNRKFLTVGSFFDTVLFRIGDWTLTFMGGLHNGNVFVYEMQMWYFSAMLISILLLYPLMRRFRYLFPAMIAPLLTLLCFGKLHMTFGTVCVLFDWVGICYAGMLRAIGSLCIGNILFHIVRKTSLTTLSQLQHIIVITAELFLIVLSLHYMQHYASWRDFALIICLTVLLWLALAFPGWLNCLCQNPMIAFLGKLSKAIYISHTILLWIPPHYWPARWRYEYLAYLISAVLLGLFCYFVEPYLVKMWNTLTKRIRATGPVR